MRHAWIIPATVSYFRLAAIAYLPLIYFGGYWPYVGVHAVILAALSDLLDGFLARMLRCESEWGRALDIRADKCCGVGCAIVVGDMSGYDLGWVLILATSILFEVASWIMYRIRWIDHTCYAGKIKVGLQFSALSAFFSAHHGWASLDVIGPTWWILVVALGFGTWSWGHYLARWPDLPALREILPRIMNGKRPDAL